MSAAVVVPCFNEAKRLSATGFAQILTDPHVQIVFVDDGSRDDTYARLTQFADAHAGRVVVLRMERNRGKAEAVRAGMRRAIADGADAVGYCDADLATPPEELLRLLGALTPGIDVVLGSRVVMLGTRIERSFFRHVVGRGFATAIAVLSDLSVYDSQCGAKWFRTSSALRDALAEPFACRWLFDVELLLRLQEQEPRTVFKEVPLHAWHDTGDSRVGVRGGLHALMDLERLRRQRLRAPGKS